MHVVCKDAFHLQGEFLLIYESVNLEVMLKATEVHIGGPDACQCVVGHD